MSQLNSLDILNFCLIGFNIITALIILNWTLSFYFLRQYPCLKPRQPVIPILIGSFNTIFCAAERSQILIHSNLSEPIEYPGWIIVNAFIIQLATLTFFLLAYRGWNIYYNIKFNKALQDTEWRLYINPAENNWFLKKRQSFGNPKKMIFPFLIPWILTAAFYMFLIIKDMEFTTLSRCTLMVQIMMVVLFLLYIWYKIPKFDDTWRVRHEFILTIRMLLIGSVILFILGIVLYWKPGTWRYAVFSTFATISVFLISYSTLFYPMYRFKLPSFAIYAYHIGKATNILRAMELSQAVNYSMPILK